MRSHYRTLRLALLFACARATLFAQAVTSAAPAPPDGAASGTIWDAIANNAVGFTIVFVLVSAMIGALIKNRQRDRVLKAFNKFNATVVLADGTRRDGVMRVYPSGVEFRYAAPFHDASGHEELSFIVYEGEYGHVRAIVRQSDRLTPEMTKLRREELERFINPSFGLRFMRFLTIQLSILKDAITQSFSLLVGAAGKATKVGARAGTVLQSQDKQLNQLSGTVIGVVDRANDPIFESMFGHGCVIEVPEPNGIWREIPGYFKDYSAQWMSLLHASWPLALTLKFEPKQAEMELPQRNVFLRRTGSKLVVENKHRRNVELVWHKPLDGPAVHPNLEVLPGSSAEVAIDVPLEQALLVKLNVLEPADIIVPRGTTVLRHRGGKMQAKSAEEFCRHE